MKRNVQDSWITTYVKNKPLEVTLQVIGVGILLLNLWLASKLSPLVQGLNLLTERVVAIEKVVPTVQDQNTDIQVIKEQVIGIREDIKEIKRALIGK
jgi:hypothetical protein